MVTIVNKMIFDNQSNDPIQLATNRLDTVFTAFNGHCIQTSLQI